MTLNSSTYVIDKFDAHDVFHKVNRLIFAPSWTLWTDEHDTTFNSEVFIEPTNIWVIANERGQGLPARLKVHYRPDGPLVTPEQAAIHPDGCAPNDPDCECDLDYDRTPCWLRVNLDTGAPSVPFRGENGVELHARLIAELGSWLSESHVTWRWTSDFTVNVYDGFNGLDTAPTPGITDSGWYRDIVMPAITKNASQA